MSSLRQRLLKSAILVLKNTLDVDQGNCSGSLSMYITESSSVFQPNKLLIERHYRLVRCSRVPSKDRLP